MEHHVRSLTTAAADADLVGRARSATRIAFIVPPSDERILRGYYCTSTSKGRYYWPQIDLWVQGSYLQPFADVRVFDGVFLSRQEMWKQIRYFDPQLAVILVGGFTERDDRAFAAEFYERIRAPWVASGEAVLFPRTIWQGMPGLLGLLTNFAGNGLARLLTDGVAGEGFVPLVSGVAIDQQYPEQLSWGPPPDWELKGYRFPMLGRPVASVMTAFGCPFTCNYCTNNRNILGLRFRDLDNLMQEFDVWAERGLRNLYIWDVNFGGTAPRAKEILARMARAQYGFRWSTFLRPEILDEEFADLLRAAGCVQVQMGVESANPHVLQSVERHGSRQRIERAFAMLDARGIRRGGHFVLGLPGESVSDVLQTIAFAQKLDPDYAAFNTGVVRAGTVHYRTGKETGDCTVARGDLLGQIERRQLEALRRRAVWSTYLRPAFARRILATMVRNPELVLDIISDGAALLGRLLFEAIRALPSTLRRNYPPPAVATNE